MHVEPKMQHKNERFRSNFADFEAIKYEQSNNALNVPTKRMQLTTKFNYRTYVVLKYLRSVS